MKTTLKSCQTFCNTLYDMWKHLYVVILICLLAFYDALCWVLMDKKALVHHTGTKSQFISINSLEFDTWKSVNFVKNDILQMQFLWKNWLLKCDFCENFDFEIAIFVKILILKMQFFVAKIGIGKTFHQNQISVLPQCD